MLKFKLETDYCLVDKPLNGGEQHVTNLSLTLKLNTFFNEM